MKAIFKESFWTVVRSVPGSLWICGSVVTLFKKHCYFLMLMFAYAHFINNIKNLASEDTTARTQISTLNLEVKQQNWFKPMKNTLIWPILIKYCPFDPYEVRLVPAIWNVCLLVTLFKKHCYFLMWTFAFVLIC